MIKEETFWDPDWEYDKSLYAIPGKGPSAVDQLNQFLKDNPGARIISITNHPSKRVSEHSDVRTTAYITVYFEVSE